MFRLKDLAVRKKFLLALLTVNLLTLLLAYGAFLLYDRREIRKSMVRQMNTIADVLCYNCTAALLFNDRADAQETLNFLSTKPSIVSAWIYNQKGTVLAGYVRSGENATTGAPGLRPDGHRFKDGDIELFKMIDVDGKPIGTLCIQSSMNEMTVIIRNHSLVAALALCFAIFFSFLLSLKMQRGIVNPIVELAALSKKISKSKDYSVRGQKYGHDEVGSLVDAFNDMLQQIGRQNESLEKAREEAEKSAREALQLARDLTQANLKLENEISVRKNVEKTLQKHRELLETRVQERTLELRNTNHKLTLEIVERKAAETRIQDSLDEKVLLLGEIHHRVKNNLQVISSLLDLTRRRTLNPEAREVLAEARSKIYAMSLVHSQLYRSESFNRIDMAVHVRRLLGSISQVYSSAYRRIRPVLECEHVQLSVTQAIPCALVLNELISNVYKHAYPENVKGNCFISMNISEDNRLHFRVRDEGKGMPRDLDIENTETLGVKLIRNLVRKQLKGEVRFNSNKGTDVMAQFPIDHDDVLVHGGPEFTADGRFASREKTSKRGKPEEEPHVRA